MMNKKTSDSILIKRLLIQSRPYRIHILCIFFLGLLATPLALLLPVPLKIAIDSVIGSDPLPELLQFMIPHSIASSKVALLIFAVVMQVGIVLLMDLQGLGSYVLQTFTGERLTLGFRERLFRHVQRLSFTFLDSRGTADSIYRIQYDAPSIQYITIYGIIPLITSIITLISMIYVTACINLQLALIALAISPFLYFLARSYNVRMRERYRDIKGMESNVLNIIQEVLTAFRVVKAFGTEEREQKRFTQHSSETINARVRLSFVEGGFSVVTNTLVAVGTASVLFIGIRNVISGAITLGELLMVMAYISQLYGPLTAISKQVAALQSSFVSAQRAYEIIDEIPDVSERSNPLPLKRSKGAIDFQDVFFSYDGKEYVLENTSFSVLPGTRLGIAGKTGAGKTTLVSLLTRFYDPSSGKLLLDGIDVRDYRLSDLRNQFSIVLQEPVLFSASIAENIAYGRPDAGMDDIKAAAAAARAHDFIINLPDGYETLVGERGMRLSGGERQRISLARAFLKDAPILILDEPTSSLDVKTESEIMDVIKTLMEDRTTFLVSHRLSVLNHCDMILAVENGSARVKIPEPLKTKRDFEKLKHEVADSVKKGT